MIASWMIYIGLVSAAATIAAVVIQIVLRASRTPVRFLWVAGICFPILAAIASARLPVAEQSGQLLLPERESPASATRFVPRPLSITVPPNARLAVVESTLIALWLGSCVLMLGVFGVAATRLRRVRSVAEVREVDGVRVFVTPSTGPLVVGVLHPQILIPKWVLELDPADRQLVVAHEHEHLRARDPALLAFSALAVGFTPWNPFAWYMLRRLRQAIELDCDRRVLAERPDLRAYTRLLLSVASRRQTNLIPLAGLAASTSSLEQRFRSMTINPAHNRGYRLISALAIVALLLVATAMIPRPIRTTQPSATLTLGQNGARATGRVKVMSASKVLTYRIYATGGAFADAKESPRARTDTIMGSVPGFPSAGDVFNIDVTDGDVHFVSIDTSSIRLEAAMSGSSPALWLSATGRHIVIQQGGAGIHGPGARQAADPATNAFFEYQVDEPVVLRESVKPTYPAALKSSGIRGEVWAQFVVDETGRVDMRTFRSLKSPDPQFATAVRAVLAKYRFEPAIKQGKKVKQVVQQAFVFGLPPKS